MGLYWAKAFESECQAGSQKWFTAQTAMELFDLFGGVKGALGFLKSMENARKLAKLKTALKGRKLTRKQLAKLIKDVDPTYNPNLARKASTRVTRNMIYGKGAEVLKNHNFISLTRSQATALIGGLADATTILSSSAFAVVHDHLLIACQRDFLVALLDESPRRKPLLTSVDYARINAELDNAQETPASWQWFARTHFGLGGIVLREKQDGWLLSGCLFERRPKSK